MRRVIVSSVLALVATLFVSTAPAVASSSYTVTAIVSATNVDVGDSFTVRGHISPLARKEWAIVQRLTSTGWTKVTRVRIGKWGNYRATVPVTDPGDTTYRVLKRRSHGHLRGVSPTFVVTGWRWRPLTTLPTYGTITNAAVLASGTLGTSTYPATYTPLIRLGSAAGDDGSISYLLANKCTKFDGDVGVTPGSTSTADQLANVGVIATNGGAVTQIAGQTVTVNQDPSHVARSGSVISGAYALNLGTTLDAGATDTYVGWGGAKVYCKS